MASILAPIATAAPATQPIPHLPPPKQQRPSSTLSHAAGKPQNAAPAAPPTSTGNSEPHATATAGESIPAAPVREQTATPARFDAAYLKNPPPAYPLASRRQQESGKVLLKVFVSPEGSPVTVDIAQSSHSTRLDEAARQAVSRWRFIPARMGDKAIAAEVLVPIIFKLDD